MNYDILLYIWEFNYNLPQYLLKTCLPFSFAVEMANSLRAFAKGEFRALLWTVSDFNIVFDFNASTVVTCWFDPNIA